MASKAIARLTAIIVPALLLVLACASGPAAQEENPQNTRPSPSASPTAAPVVLGGHYVGEFAGNSFGGVRTGTAYASELMLQGSFDLARLMESPGLGKVHLVLTAREGSSLSANAIGNIFTVQEIYGDGLTPRVTELSYDQPIAGGRSDFYFGRINTENDFAASSTYWGGVALYCTYQNNAICGTPIAAPIDSGYVPYPSSAWGARFKGYPTKDLYIEAGAYEVNPQNALRGHGLNFSFTGDTGTYLPLEIGQTLRDPAGNFVGTIKIGGYYDTSLAPTIQSQVTHFLIAPNPAIAAVPQTYFRGRYGFWLLLDHMLTGSSAQGQRGLAAFGALQYGDPQTAELSFFADGGLVQHGTFAGRDGDTASIGFAYTNVNPRLRNEELALQDAGFSVPVNGQETMAEVNYGYRVTPTFVVRPGLQYVWQPSGNVNIPNALVYALQGVVTF